jgi:glycosyltransferase 2 family protein
MHDSRRRLWTLLRLVVSAGLLAWLVGQAGLPELWQAAAQADLRPYSLALVVAVAGIVVRALRWYLLLRAAGARLPFRRTLYLYYLGAFFNAFLPTGFGGDVVRVLAAGPGATSQQAAGTALVDRMTGFMALFGLALATLPFSARLLPAGWLASIALLAIGVLGLSTLLLHGRLLRRLTAWLPGRLSLAGEAWVGKTYSVITACGRRGLGGALLLSAWFNLQLVLQGVLVARALDMAVSPWAFFVLVPLATASLLVPVAVSGLGVREGVYVTLLGHMGVSPAQAVALSLGTYGLDLSMALVGGLIYLAAGLRPAAEGGGQAIHGEGRAAGEG